MPPFAPPLGGHLTIKWYRGRGILEKMINLFGGIRFRHMELYYVRSMRLLLDACAETLESVVLTPTDILDSERYSLKGLQVLTNGFLGELSFRDFDLSRNKSLRTLWIPAASINGAPPRSNLKSTAAFLTRVLPTITSPAPLKVTILFEDRDFRGIRPWHSDWPPLRERSQTEREEEASRHCERFGVLREAHKVRDFQLVLCARVWGCVGEYLLRRLEEAVAEEKARNGFGNSFPEPLVVCDLQRTYPGY